MKRLLIILTALILAACGAAAAQPESQAPAVPKTARQTDSSVAPISKSNSPAKQEDADLDEIYAALTESAQDIADLQKQVNALGTQVAQLSNKPVVTGGGTGGDSTTGGGPSPTATIPANVVTVKVKTKANLRGVVEIKDGKMVMEIVEPRIQFAPGEWIMVYRPSIFDADGEEYYAVFTARGAGLYIRVSDTNRP